MLNPKMLPQQYCLRWRYHHSNLQTMFSQLLERQAFCDVTIACEGQTLKAHKIVLSACSTYFDTILSQYEEKDPILIMKDVKFVDIKCLVEFMYRGEINVEHCHLATLLKTAEELRIKGLAEVSWREEEPSNESQTVNGVHGGSGAQSSMSDGGEPPNKRKRGRPPIDDYDQQFQSPKIANVSGANNTQGNNDNDNFSTNDVTNSDADASAWEDEHNNENTDTEQKYQPNDNEDFQADDNTSEPNDKSAKASQSQSQSAPSTPSVSQSALEANWPDVIKMNDYLNTGRRQQFWEEPFTKRVMDAIKNKDLEMKAAAELLGVSYGTLYGRYRDAYGCLKHPYRVRDFWTESGPADILSKLQRKEITLFRAAEQLNVTPQTLSNYLLSLHTGNDSNEANSSQLGQYDGYEEMPDSDDEKDNTILPDVPARPSSSSSARSASITATNILQNHPDITIIKKEKKEEVKVNNNSDHSEPVSDDNDA